MTEQRISGPALRRIREDLGMTREDVAVATGGEIAADSIRRIEREAWPNMRTRTLEILATAYRRSLPALTVDASIPVAPPTMHAPDASLQTKTTNTP